jgi:hypothetical protein
MRSPTLDRARYTSELLARVAAGWQQLSDHERHGVILAARITADLSSLGAPPTILALAVHVIRDEIRHLEVCGRVLDELGATHIPQARHIELAIGLPRPSLTIEGALARTLVTDFALGKPMTATSFATARAVVREPLLAWAYTELLHDETRHATFGAKAAAWVIRHWSPRQREALWAACLTAETSGLQSLLRDPEAEALGLLPVDSDGLLPRWILPHLAPLGMASRPSNDHALLH